RTAEGRSRAKARGQHMGRPLKLTPQQQKEARRRRAEGATLKELAKSYNVGPATISRLQPLKSSEWHPLHADRYVRGDTGAPICWLIYAAA
ncbi:MAG TPA: helix-turn-helix domain-containing protein, partial [Terracidiphilus sp.]|nr:helix-turn-helix domain-containing protein [Terracidiphilus sp.]